MRGSFRIVNKLTSLLPHTWSLHSWLKSLWLIILVVLYDSIASHRDLWMRDATRQPWSHGHAASSNPCGLCPGSLTADRYGEEVWQWTKCSVSPHLEYRQHPPSRLLSAFSLSLACLTHPKTISFYLTLPTTLRHDTDIPPRKLPPPPRYTALLHYTTPCCPWPGL